MQLATFVLAALSATASAVPRASPSATPVPTATPVPSGSMEVGAKEVPQGYDNLFSLVKDTSKLICYLRIASDTCNGDSGKISNYNGEDNICHAASVSDNHGAANATFADCPGLRGFLYFADGKIEGTAVHKGSFVVQNEKTDGSEYPMFAVDLGVQADCSVGQKHGKSEYSRACAN